ncbi:MAG TPA: UvrD-helicase domain-containing protein, partial [Trueperaceae bacterium]|nr:UvrD-helicase domain-containing protein [Trueperaceae bacterium]
MSDALTAEQATAVAAAGSVAVVAGAGTGKTKLLAHRYLHHLDQGFSPLEVVAVTFTEKAADELRSRIRSLVRGPRPEYRRAAVEIEAAQISTIHALAARICREHPAAAEVAPDFAILDDLDSVIWRAERLEEAIVALPPTILDELDIGTLRFVLDRLLKDPLAAGAALSHGPEQWRALLEREKASALRAVIAAAAWAEGRSTLENYSGAAHDKGEVARLACLRAMTAFETGDAAAALEAVNSFRANAGQLGNWAGGGLAEVKAALKTIKDLLKDACDKDGRALLEWGPADDELARLLPLLRDAFQAASAHMEAARLRDRKLDFTALEVHALRALANPEVVAYYARRWRAILVDEFQDTNRAQAELLDRLREAAEVTVVGDEKQAIYGFRGADVTIFRRYREELIRAGGGEVVLAHTFRSHEGLVAEFEGVFPTLLGDLHQSLRAARLQTPGTGPYLTFHPVVVSHGKARKLAKRLSEAHVIAGLIADLVAAKTPI